MKGMRTRVITVTLLSPPPVSFKIHVSVCHTRSMIFPYISGFTGSLRKIRGVRFPSTTKTSSAFIILFSLSEFPSALATFSRWRCVALLWAPATCAPSCVVAVSVSEQPPHHHGWKPPC